MQPENSVVVWELLSRAYMYVRISLSKFVNDLMLKTMQWSRAELVSERSGAGDGSERSG